MDSTFDNSKSNIAQRRFLFGTAIFNTCNSKQAGAKNGLKTDIEKSIKSKKGSGKTEKKGKKTWKNFASGREYAHGKNNNISVR
jgi:hypothetical protein